MMRVYDCIIDEMLAGYAKSGNPSAVAYKDWPRFSKISYTSDTHGGRLVNNYADEIAESEYNKFEDGGTMPVGSAQVRMNHPDGVSRGGTMRNIVLCLLPAVTLLLVVPASAETITGASRIIDGDSLEVAGRKIDLLGVDAPELGQSCHWPRKVIDCGLIAKSALMDLTAGVSVVCDLEAAQDDGNALGVCRAAGYDLSEGMAHTGCWAVALGDAPQRYKTAMAGAREAERALWRGEFELPWIWRAQVGEGRSVTSLWARKIRINSPLRRRAE